MENAVHSIAREFESVKLSDARKAKSLLKTAELLGRNPAAAPSVALGPQFRKTASRILSDPNAKPDDILAGHFEETAKRASEYDTVVVVQDTTFYNLTGHSKMKGIGTLQQNTKGFVQHNVKAFSQTGLPLGLIAQKTWARGGPDAPVSEGRKWTEIGLQAVADRLPDAKKVVLVQDREADSHDFLSADRPANVELLLRVHRPRQYAEASSDALKYAELKNMFEELKQETSFTASVYRNGSETEIRLTARFSPVRIKMPKKRGSGPDLDGFWLVWVKEQTAGETDSEGAEWLLLSTDPVETAEAAVTAARTYTQRWRIERFHYVLKSGCEVEKLQFDDAHTVFNAMAVYSVVAWRLLALLYAAREEEADHPTEQYAEEEEITVLEAKFKIKPANLKELILMIGKLAGFEPSKRTPMPGVKKLWEGLQILRHTAEGVRIARQFYATS